MTIGLPNTLSDIITKVRRVTGRPSSTQISDAEIVKYINTFYIYDMPEHLKMESLRYNYQFTTTANIPVYDMPTGIYLTAMPPVFIGGYQSYMTQSRENFFRINPSLNFLQQSIYTSSGALAYSGQFLTQTPIIPGFKTNPPGAYSAITSMPAKFLNWNVLVSALGSSVGIISGIAPSYSLIDDGQGNLFAPTDTSLVTPRGSINYITGALSIINFVDSSGTPVTIPIGNSINVQYIPYVASRPQSVVFFQDQFIVYPIPDQAYTVSFEVYKYPADFTVASNGTFDGGLTPQLTEWWQLLAYGAADKIFSDNADFENLQKYRPLLEEQMRLALRRTIVQQTAERTATIYTEQSQFPQYPFGNLFSGF
jgi:hypothetical protein